MRQLPGRSKSEQADLDADGEGDVCDLDDGLISSRCQTTRVSSGKTSRDSDHSTSIGRSEYSQKHRYLHSGSRRESTRDSELQPQGAFVIDGPDPPPGQAVFLFRDRNFGNNESSLVRAARESSG